MSLLLTLLIYLLILGLIWWAVSLLPLPAPFLQIARVVVIVIAIVLLIGLLTGSMGIPRFPL